MRLLSQLAHVELTTPVPQESLAFWTELVGSGGDDPRGSIRVPAGLGRPLPSHAQAHRGSRGVADAHRLAR